MTHRLRRPSVPIAAISCFVAACGPTDVERDGALQVRDSLGTEIVTNAQPMVALALSEVLRIGETGGNLDSVFHQVRAIGLDPSGGFWVTDASEGVRHYGPEGRYIGSVGGRGEGPGESEFYYTSVVRVMRSFFRALGFFSSLRAREP